MFATARLRALRLKFFWHRPSWAAVEEQSADPETAADPNTNYAVHAVTPHSDLLQVRIFLNGCFDLMHARASAPPCNTIRSNSTSASPAKVGHFNALRQAKRLFFQQGYKKATAGPRFFAGTAHLHSRVWLPHNCRMAWTSGRWLCLPGFTLMKPLLDRKALL